MQNDKHASNTTICDRCFGTGWQSHPDDPNGRCEKCGGSGGVSEITPELSDMNEQASEEMGRLLDAKAVEILDPLFREMEAKCMGPKFRSILWYVVGKKALALAKQEAANARG